MSFFALTFARRGSAIPSSSRRTIVSNVTSPLFQDSDTTLSGLTIDESDDDPRVRTPLPSVNRKPHKLPTPSERMAHRLAIKQEFPAGWSPPRRLSREAMEGLRQLHYYDPRKFTTPVLAEEFKISPEAVTKILKSKWQPTPEQRKKLREREEAARQEKRFAQRMLESNAMTEINMAPRIRRHGELPAYVPPPPGPPREPVRDTRAMRRMEHERDGRSRVRGFRDANGRLVAHPNKMARAGRTHQDYTGREPDGVEWHFPDAEGSEAKGINNADKLSFK